MSGDLTHREARAMPMPRVRFTIRRLMMAVAGVALLLALWPVWLAVGIAGSFVGLPVMVVIFRGLHVPAGRLPWRSGFAAAAPGFLILAGGWFWARSVISHFQRQEGRLAIRAAARWNDYAYWGLTVPMIATGLGLAAFVVRVVMRCGSRRRSDLMLAAVAYGWGLAAAWLISFGWLHQEMTR